MKPIVTPLPTFTPEAFAAATASLFSVGNAIANAMTKAEAPKGLWSRMAAVAIVNNDVAFDIEDVGAALILAAQSTVGKRKAAGLKTVSDVKALGGGYATVIGWFYDLKRVAAASLLPLLLEQSPEGAFVHSLTGLRRGTDPTQSQSRKGKGKAKTAKGKADAEPPKAVIQPLSLEGIAAQLKADAKRMTGKALREQQVHIATIIQSATAMARKVEAFIKANPPKAAKAKTVRKAKAA